MVGDHRLPVAGEHLDHPAIEQDSDREPAVAPGDRPGVASGIGGVERRAARLSLPETRSARDEVRRHAIGVLKAGPETPRTRGTASLSVARSECEDGGDVREAARCR